MANPGRPGSRQLKKEILAFLEDSDAERGLERICQIPLKKVVSPLFSFFYYHDRLTKWRAVTAMGRVVSELAVGDMEAARVVLRRLMWNLNDESGGIGWGSPEAMGEIMAKSDKIAREFHHILISYMNPDGNYIEHEMLQRGVLWGVGRLAHARPQYVKGAAGLLHPYMESEDPEIRGLAAWTVSLYEPHAENQRLAQLSKDPASFTFYKDGSLTTVSVGSLSRLSKGESA